VRTQQSDEGCTEGLFRLLCPGEESKEICPGQSQFLNKGTRSAAQRKVYRKGIHGGTWGSIQVPCVILPSFTPVGAICRLASLMLPPSPHILSISILLTVYFHIIKIMHVYYIFVHYRNNAGSL
jgi:hypothetical protein